LIVLAGVSLVTFTLVSRAQTLLDSPLLLSCIVSLATGSLILARADGHRIGWVLAAIGLALGGAAAAGAVADNVEMSDEARLVASAVGGACFLSMFFLIGLLLFWFPTGQPLSPRWRWIGWPGWAAEVILLMYAVSEELCLDEGGGQCQAWAKNPIGIPGVPNPEFGSLSGVTFGLLIFFAVGAAVSLVIRYLRARGEERVQIKWLFFAVVSIVALIVLWEILDDWVYFPWSELLFGLAILSLPVAVGVSILRYRLYEIDRIVSRTVSYLLVVGLLGSIYLGGFLLITDVLPFDNDLGVAAATLAVAALFNPVRLRVQRAVDRRFNRTRYNAEKVMQDFSDTLRERVDPDGVIDGWLGVVSETMHPSASGVWIRAKGGAVSP
jgi:hypothetical protein